MKQLRLPASEPSKTIHPEPARPEPVLWVRRLVIVQELLPGKRHVVRNIELRRGLNIIWTPPRSTKKHKLFQSGIEGHTAGKTTLCRLIRYALGEQSFSNEGTRRRIRGKFPDGWLLAEIVVGGTEWAVARPLGIGAHPFCKSDARFGELFTNEKRLEYQAFLDAVALNTIKPLPSQNLPTTNNPVQWGHLLPWLSRDQECRFTDFVEWRHSSSDSESPVLNSDERQFMVRSVLGLISDQERAEQLRNCQLVDEKKEASQLVTQLEKQAAVDRKRLASIRPNTVETESFELAANQQLANVRNQIADIEKELAALQTPEIDKLREIADAAVGQESIAKREVEIEEALLREAQDTQGNLAVSKAYDPLLEGLSAPRGRCNQMIHIAREAKCPLATTVSEDFEAGKSKRIAQTEQERHQAEIARVQQSLAKKRESLTQKIAQRTEAKTQELAARTARDNHRGLLFAQREQLNRTVSKWEESIQTALLVLKEKERVERLGRDIQTSCAKQEKLREENTTRLGHLTRTFDYVVRAMLGDDVAARVGVVGRSLSLSIEHNGERESAAIATVKLLAFDLAAMTESIEGRGFFPRFLLHDGPREADLAQDIYDRLFIYARGLEACSDKNEPSFQYIITTTTPPPTQFRDSKWCRLILAGMPTKKRLFKCDL